MRRAWFVVAMAFVLAGVLSAVRGENVVFFQTPPAPAGWTSLGSFLTANDLTGATTWAPTTSATLNAGEVGVCVMGKDETASISTDGVFAQVYSLIDAAGNLWEQDGSTWCNGQTSTDANGACASVWWTNASETLTSGSTITATFSNTTTAKAMTCWRFSVQGDNGALPTAGANGLANDAADPGSMTVATGVSAGHLFIRGTACETDNTGYTEDTDYTTFTHTSSTADGGPAASSMGARGEYRIATESTSAASDPTYDASDCASYMLGLDQSAGIDCGAADLSDDFADNNLTEYTCSADSLGSIWVASSGIANVNVSDEEICMHQTTMSVSDIVVCAKLVTSSPGTNGCGIVVRGEQSTASTGNSELYRANAVIVGSSAVKWDCRRNDDGTNSSNLFSINHGLTINNHTVCARVYRTDQSTQMRVWMFDSGWTPTNYVWGNETAWNEAAVFRTFMNRANVGDCDTGNTYIGITALNGSTDCALDDLRAWNLPCS